MDATVKSQDNKHGYGIVVQDSQNNIIASFLSSATSGLPLIYAEAEALLRALSWCQAVHFPIDIIVTDYQVLVSKILKQQKDLLALSSLIWKIIHSLSSFPNASINFTPRTNNFMVHDLPRRALGTDEELI
uniref:RNase H type-1 domain-containing protein n=1 Tax=Cannabis sativa TaxID=3483 RepID=A0A803QJR0_CANSA